MTTTTTTSSNSHTVTISVIKTAAAPPLPLGILEVTVAPGSTEVVVAKVSTTSDNIIVDGGVIIIPGMQILALDDLTMTTADQVLQQWKSAEVGQQVKLTFAGLGVQLVKPTAETALGMSLQPCPATSSVRISKISSWGLVATATAANNYKAADQLKVGHKITSVHCYCGGGGASKPPQKTLLVCPTDAWQVMNVLKTAVGEITLTAVPVTGLVTTTVTKPTLTSKIGVILNKRMSGEGESSHYIAIAKITPGGLLDQTLQMLPSSNDNSKTGKILNHRVVSINGIPCPPTTAEANAIIKRATNRAVVFETMPMPAPVVVPEGRVAPVIPTLQPGQVLATITRQSTPSDSKIGLKLRRVYDNRRGTSRLVVSSVDKTLALELLGKQQQHNSGTPSGLMCGMHLVSINSQSIIEQQEMTPKQATELFAKALSSSDTIHVVASPIIAHVPPSSSSDNKNKKLGLSLGKLKVGVVVAYVDPNGLLADSELQVGQKIVAINKHKCPLQPKQAVELLRQEWERTGLESGSGGLTITALDVVPEMIPTWPQECLVVAHAHKPTVDTLVGLGLARSQQGRVVISRINEYGLLAGQSNSRLQVGLVLLWINGMKCPSLHSQAIQLIQQAQGELVLVAAKSMESATKLVPYSSSCKGSMGIEFAAASASSNTGSIHGPSGGGVIISKLDSENGLFRWKVLQEGQRVLKINGLPCPDQPEMAMALLQGAPVGSSVSIEAVDTLASSSPLSYWPTDCLITVSATKKYAHQAIGLRLATSLTHPDRLVISHVDEGAGIFGKRLEQQLLPGMILVSINGQECPTTCEEALAVLHSFPHDKPLEIVAAKCVTHLYRQSLHDTTAKWGIALARMRLRNADNEIVIYQVDPKGWVATSLPRSLIQPRQRIVEIDGQPCPNDVKLAAEFLRNAITTNKRKSTITTVDTFLKEWSSDEELVVVVHKKVAATRVGLGIMKSSQDRIAVSFVDREDGLFAKTAVEVGYVVVSINGLPCPSTTKDTIATIAKAVGDLTVVFAHTIATVQKPSPDAALGIKLGRMRKQGVIVHSIAPDSLFAKTTSLTVRQKIVTINGAPCPKSLDQAAALLRTIDSKMVTIEAIDAVYPMWGPECLITISVQKKSRQRFVGLDFGLSKQGRLAISRVDDKGLFANSRLAEGQVVVSINGETVDSTLEAISRVQACSGSLVLVVAQSVAQASKPYSDESIGITFGLHPDIGVVIEDIDSDGLFGASRLVVGQKVITINSTLCPVSISEVLALCKQSEGPLEIIARDAMDPPTWPKEGLVTALVEKETVNSKVGIGFAKSIQGRVVIATLSRKGPLAGSGLHIGQIVVSINDDLAPESPYEAFKAVQETVGQVSIVATSIVASTTKATKDKKVGIAIGRTTKGLVISKIDPSGLFAGSMLQKDQVIRTINGQPCPVRVDDAISMLRSAEGPIKLVVVDSLRYKFEWPPECLITVEATKAYPGQYVGLDVKTSLQGRMSIARVDPRGIFFEKGLLQGYVVVSINGIDCPNTAEDTTRLLNQAKKDVTLVVARSVAQVEKRTVSSKVGLIIGVTEKQGVIIHDIDPNGLFCKSTLMKHQKILSINGVPCPPTVKETTKLLNEANKGIVLEAVDAVYPDHNPEALYTAVAKRSPERNFCGIEIVRSSQGRICIGRVNPAGVFAKTGLVPGHVIVSINGWDCPEHVKKAVDLLKCQGEGDIGIVVSSTIAKARKDSSTSFLGIDIRKTKTQGLIVHSVDPTGLFGGTQLKELQQILSINGRPCPLEVKAALVMLGAADDDLTVVAVDGVRPEWPSECIVTSSVQKLTQDDFVGVEVERVATCSGESRLVISRLDSLGLFAKCPDLMVGQALVSINGFQCPSSPQEFLVDLRQASCGELVLVTARTLVTVEKTSKETEVGISLGAATKRDGTTEVVVTRVAKDGLFQSTLMREGLRIVRINGATCPSTVPEAISVIKATIGNLSIEAVDRLPVYPGRVTVSIKKPSAEAKLGIAMRKSLQERIVISTIDPGGLVDKSTELLRVGQHVQSINHETCPGTPKEAVQLIAEAKSVVTIQASSTVAKVTKSKSTDKKFGLSLGKNSNGVVVYKIKAGGLFGKTPLRVGQKLVSINGHPCPEEVADAIQIIREAPDVVELETVDVLYHWSAEDKKKLEAPPEQARDASLPARASTAFISQTGNLTVTAVKESVDSKVGFTLKESDEKVVLGDMDPTGLFGRSGLQKGQRVILINGLACPNSAKEAAELIRRHVGTISIQVES